MLAHDEQRRTAAAFVHERRRGSLCGALIVFAVAFHFVFYLVCACQRDNGIIAMKNINKKLA